MTTESTTPNNDSIKQKLSWHGRGDRDVSKEGHEYFIIENYPLKLMQLDHLTPIFKWAIYFYYSYMF